MKFSFSLPTIRHPERKDPFEETYALARLAEEAGFDTATIGHHHFMPGNQSDPLTFMATVAARTTTLRVGTLVLNMPVKHIGDYRGIDQHCESCFPAEGGCHEGAVPIPC